MRRAHLSGGWDSSFSSQVGYATIDGEGVRRAVPVDPVVLVGPPPFLGFDRFISERGVGLGTRGGGIRVAGAARIAVSRSLIRHNQDGGILGTGQVTLLNSFVSDNVNTAGGGGIESAGSVWLSQSTIARNETAFGGGGIRSFNLYALNSTVSGDHRAVDAIACQRVCVNAG